jgi:NAD-dependent dihydropyrimidine dehydrogenase PreA subunit
MTLEKSTEDIAIYKKLQEFLDKMPVGFPATKSGVEIRILKHLFTPKEAEIAMNLILGYETVEVIYKRFKGTDFTLDELKKNLNKMVSKGLLNIKKENGNKLYGLALLVVGIYEYQVNQLDKTFLEDMSRYADEGFDREFFGTKISQLRIVPVEESITPEHYVPTYEEIRKIVENAKEPAAVGDCVCRKSKIVKGRPKCKTTSRLQTCMGFGNYAQMYIDQGWARQVTKAEAIKVLEKNMEEGLVFQVTNVKDPYFICSCCTCCCGMLDDLKSFPRAVTFIHSNYYAEIDKDMCMGCETCVERCPMGAIKMKNGLAKVMLRKCIGCGNCVPICPEETIQLIKKEDEHVPPDTMEELYDKILEKKMEIRSKK